MKYEKRIKDLLITRSSLETISILYILRLGIALVSKRFSKFISVYIGWILKRINNGIPVAFILKDSMWGIGKKTK